MNPSLAVPSGVIKPLYRGSSLHSCQVSIQRGFNNWRKIPGLVLHHSEDPGSQEENQQGTQQGPQEGPQEGPEDGLKQATPNNLQNPELSIKSNARNHMLVLTKH